VRATHAAMRVLTLLLLALALPLPEAESWWSDERDPQAAPPCKRAS
jgi:hypothetical protein